MIVLNSYMMDLDLGIVLNSYKMDLDLFYCFEFLEDGSRSL